MGQNPTYLNGLQLTNSPENIKGEYVLIDNEEYYKIQNYDLIRSFFISLVSYSDHWMFISSTGGLSAGRRNSESALFPYYTDDKISDDFEVTGSKTIIRVKDEGKEALWEPFSNRFKRGYKTERNFYKNRPGNKIIFEEINHDLQLTFRYAWCFSEKYGFVKDSSLLNTDSSTRELEILDGVQNLLPYGVTSALQANASNLVNAYKKNELDVNSGLGLFMLSAIIVDKAEPSEALKTTSVWSKGLKADKILLSSLQLDAFREGREIEQEVDIRAERGAYFILSEQTLEPEEEKSWIVVAEVNQDHADVVHLIKELTDEDQIKESLISDRKYATDKLLEIVGKADGLQLTQDKLSVGRHYSNVLFNIMRGGIFDEDYQVEKADFESYFRTINHKLYEKNSSFFDSLPAQVEYSQILQKAEEIGDLDVMRVSLEYLPLTFSRRHGDPSRPWNKFTIATKNEQGEKVRYFEGNWRDIFQNWEALGISFPGFIQSMITKFVNASTIDGYNPYRITREGIDWEVIEPDDPWSYIGYWGDHQIIYLQKLLEIGINHHQEDIIKYLQEPMFVYANVPYRIKGFQDISRDPQDTIDYDHDVENEIWKRVEEYGADGKLVFANDEVLKVNLTEKLLVTFLAKMSNYVPEGGIWLNTQRPEWNDANNALVGNGVSMVTLYYMRRFAKGMIELFSQIDEDLQLNNAVGTLFTGVQNVLINAENLLGGQISDESRFEIVQKLGVLGEEYRKEAYNGFTNDISTVASDSIVQFFETALKHIDHSIKSNRRNDGLYHAYNLLSLRNQAASVDHLYEMLEGQVAVLSSGLLNAEEAIEVLDALKASDIYREDQYSYMLYPNRTLPRFLEKNVIPKSFVESSKLAKALSQADDRSVLYSDANGDYHFNGSFNNVGSLKEALESLKQSEFSSLVSEEFDSYLAVFEEVFNHKAFTGRSGTFYGYEGLGSIYWHMVSKLLLAVQENIYSSWDQYQGTELMGRMIDHYYEIRAGIGINKEPDLYGAVPTDPYSHTPGGRGVQQPGMTGQVKEDILNRWAELGVVVKNAEITFDPLFLSDDEYLQQEGVFEYFGFGGHKQALSLNAGQLAFTYCQTPIVYQKGSEENIVVHFSNDEESSLTGKTLSQSISKEIFGRTGKIKSVVVTHNSK